ncbi:MAG: ABC transporter permease [Saprospiraceae bacterium]
MWRYIGYRVVLFIPTTIAILLIAFLLSRQTFDVDTAESWLIYDGIDPNSVEGNKAYEREYKLQNLNLPLFYFSIIPAHYHPNLNSIIDRQDRKILSSLQSEGYRCEDVLTLLEVRKNLLSTLNYRIIPDSILQALNFAESIHDFQAISSMLNYESEQAQTLNGKFHKTIQKMEERKVHFISPSFVWHGIKNQWHLWSINMLNGNMGKSIKDGRKVSQKIWNAMRWTLILLGLNLIFTLIISIPFGIWSGLKTGSWFDRLTQSFWMMLYATPVFWLASMLIMYFTSDRYGTWMDIFPVPGLWHTEPNQTFWSFLKVNSHQFILPVICLVANDIAFLSRVVRNNVRENLNKRYTKVAAAKGLSQTLVLVKHVIPNVLIPLVTIVVAAIPAGLSGGLIIEVLFNIPGVGRLMYESIQTQDWNVVFSILAIISLAVTLFLLVGDVLYAFVNPKVSIDE